MVRFCQDCNQERTDTSWSDAFRTRLCMDCYNARCDHFEAEIVTRNRRIVRVVRVTKEILQCERPYVLFGEAIRNARLDWGWTQADLSEKVGLGRASIANIETGRQRVLLTDLFAFATALKVKPQQLFDAVQK